MKNYLLLFGVLLFATSLFGQAEKSKYYIEGDYEAVVEGGQFKYKLSNIYYEGVTSTSGTYLEANELDEEQFATFIFKEMDTDYKDGTKEAYGNVKFWRWKEDKWQVDSEVRNPTPAQEKTSEMSIVLVLDCSESIGDEDFGKLKNSAIKFIETFAEQAPANSVHIGIVGFNSMKNTDKNVFPIKLLNKQTKNEMINFIGNTWNKGLQMKKNTALYYAMDKGIIMLENNARNITKEYQGSFIVTFTDGYDNNSMDAKIGAPAEGKGDPYFLHVRDRQLKKKIKSENIKSYVIAVPGKDVGDNKEMFQSILKDLADPDKFTLAENFDELNTLFEDIANELLNQWVNLECYVPPRFKGKVRWTLDTDDLGMEPEPDDKKKEDFKPEPDNENKKNYKRHLNFVLGTANLGFTYNLYYSHIFNRVGFYMYGGAGYNTYYHYTTNVKFDNTYKNFCGGLSFRFGKSNLVADIGLGYYLTDTWYYTYNDNNNFYKVEEYNLLGNLSYEFALVYKLKFIGLRAGIVGTQNDTPLSFSLGLGLAF